MSSNSKQTTQQTQMAMTNLQILDLVAQRVEILGERVATLEKQMAQLLSKSDPEPKKEKDTNMSTKNSKVKKEKKEDKPKKKRVSGYILFQKAMREDVVHRLKDALDESLAFRTLLVKQSDVMSELGKMWKALDDDEREEWNNKAAEQKASSDEE